MIEPATLPPSLLPRRCLHCGGFKTLIFETGSGKPPRQLCLLPDCKLAEQAKAARQAYAAEGRR